MKDPFSVTEIHTHCHHGHRICSRPITYW